MNEFTCTHPDRPRKPITSEAELLELIDAHRGRPLDLSAIARSVRREALGYNAIAALLSACESSAVALLCNPELRHRRIDLLVALATFQATPEKGKWPILLVHELHPAVYRAFEDFVREQVREKTDLGHDLALFLLTAGTPLETATLDAIVAGYHDHNELMIALVRHPSAGVPQWDFLGKQTPYDDLTAEFNLLSALCATPALSLPSVRARILASNITGPILSIVPHATADELRAAIPVLVRHAPKQFLEMVQKRAVESARQLARVDWLPFLEHPDSDVRELALLILSLFDETRTP